MDNYRRKLDVMYSEAASQSDNKQSFLLLVSVSEAALASEGHVLPVPSSVYCCGSPRTVGNIVQSVEGNKGIRCCK